MNTENVLKYQKQDAELYKVEQKITNSAYRKKANEMATVAKKAQGKLFDFEGEADKLLKEIEDIKEKFEMNKKKADELAEKELENLSADELEKLSVLKSKLVSNLNVLERMLQKSAENVNNILANFNKTKKVYDEARTNYTTLKKKAEDEAQILEPEREKLSKALSAFENSVDAKTLADYKKKRAEGIFPVFVSLENGAFCGFCRMEQPKIAISKLKENGVITCEHCKRYIYQ